MRTLSFAALGAAAVLGGAAVVQTAAAAAHTSHTSHASHGSSHRAGSTGGSSTADGGSGSNANSPGVSAGNGLIGCRTVSTLPVAGALPGTLLGLAPDPSGLLSSGPHAPIANMSPSGIPGILTGSACR